MIFEACRDLSLGNNALKCRHRLFIVVITLLHLITM